MALFNRTHTILPLEDGVSTDRVSHVYAIVPQHEGDFSLGVFVDLTQSGGEGNTKSTVHVETSHDGKGWIPVIAPILLEEEGEVHEFKEVAALGPLMRARTVLDGSVKPKHTAAVTLAATADFWLKVKWKASASCTAGETAASVIDDGTPV